MNKRLTLIIYGLLVLPIVLCGGLYAGEWVYTEINYRKWLNENDLRVDFSAFDARPEVRAALLKKLPIGTSEAVLKDFYFENGVQQGPWPPSELEHNILDPWNPRTVSSGYGTTFSVWGAGRGHLLHRVFAGRWIIHLELDPDTHELKDIQVSSFRGVTP